MSNLLKHITNDKCSVIMCGINTWVWTQEQGLRWLWSFECQQAGGQWSFFFLSARVTARSKWTEDNLIIYKGVCMVEGAELNRQLFVLYRGELALPEPIREKGQPGERCTYKGSSPCQNWGAKADGATERNIQTSLFCSPLISHSCLWVESTGWQGDFNTMVWSVVIFPVKQVI